MLTIFSSLKPVSIPFADNVQRNAIESWLALDLPLEILLLGNDEGTAEIAAEYGLRHNPNVHYQRGAPPLVGHLFARAQELATFNTLMFVNSDVMLISDFVPALHAIVEHGESTGKPFLAVGRRINLELKERLNFNDPSWEVFLRTEIKQRGQLDEPEALDYFIFKKGPWPGRVPKFTIGAQRYDNWMVAKARGMCMDVIDVTQGITAVQHEYEDRTQNAYKFRRLYGPEAVRQISLVPEKFSVSLYDTNMEYTRNGIKRKSFKWDHIMRFLNYYGPIRYPQYSKAFYIGFSIGNRLRSLIRKIRRIYS